MANKTNHVNFHMRRRITQQMELKLQRAMDNCFPGIETQSKNSN